MTVSDEKPSQKFGGTWTSDKLNILETYLEEYTKVLKNQNFNLIYIDAFAGTGQIELLGGSDDNDRREFISGSAIRAINVKKTRPFDKLLFVEKDPGRFEELKILRDSHPDRDIQVINSDANQFLFNLEYNWNKWRGVLFLDPFATEVEWSTIENIASFEALDTWILFPVSAIARMLPTSRMPEDIEPKWADRLTKIFGGDSWRELYKEAPQGELFGNRGMERNPGVEGLISIYKRNLRHIFGDRFLQELRTFRNSKNSVLFVFLFCVGNPRGIKPATRIAKHILEHM